MADVDLTATAPVSPPFVPVVAADASGVNVTASGETVPKSLADWQATGPISADGTLVTATGGTAARTLGEAGADAISVLSFIPHNLHSSILDRTCSADLDTYIETAINAVHDRGGGTLKIPWGLLPISQTVNWRQGVRIEGEKCNYQNYPNLGSGSWFRWHGAANLPMFASYNLQDISIARIGLDGAQVSNSGVIGIQLSTNNTPSTQGIFFSELIVANVTTGLQWGLGGSEPQMDNALIESCKFFNYWNDGIVINSGNAADNSRIENCLFSGGTGANAINLKYVPMLTIEDCMCGGQAHTFLRVDGSNLNAGSALTLTNCQSEGMTYFMDVLSGSMGDGGTITLLGCTPDAPIRVSGARVTSISTEHKFPLELNNYARWSGINERFHPSYPTAKVTGDGTGFYINSKLRNLSTYNELHSAGEVQHFAGYPVSSASVSGELTTRTGVWSALSSRLTLTLVGTLARPSVDNGHYYRCTVQGTTDVSEPSWPTGAGVTVSDGTATWTEAGASALFRQFGPLGHSVGSGPPGPYGYANVNDVIWNASPTPTAPVYWVCVAAGSPGTWVASNEIDTLLAASVNHPTSGPLYLGTDTASTAVVIGRVATTTTVQGNLVTGGGIYSAGNLFSSNAAGSAPMLRGSATDGSSAVATKLGNANPLTTAGAKIAVFYSDAGTTERGAVGKDGDWKTSANSFLDDSATTGNRTVNLPHGINSFAAGTAAVTITNSIVTATSRVFVTIQTNDATAVLKNVVPAAGSFTVNLTANATGTTQFGWTVVN